jgi:hypothetical protein
MRTSLDVIRHSRPSKSYNRVYDPTESALRTLPYGTWPVPGEFYRDYIAAWLGPVFEFTFAHQWCVNAWILAQYGLTRQEVEGVPELDWLRTLLSRGCPLDVFAYLVEHESTEEFLQLVQRHSAINFDTLILPSSRSVLFHLILPLGSWLDQLVQKWDVARLPDDARFIATLPNSFHFLRSDDYASQTRRYAFTHSYRKADERAYVFKEQARTYCWEYLRRGLRW